MKTEVKILKFLLAEPRTQRKTIRVISQVLGADYRIVHTAIHRLAQKRVLNLQAVGRATAVSLVPRFSPDLFQAEFERQGELLTDKSLATALALFQERLQTPFFVLLLFGSWAKRTQTKSSDIDLLFVIPDNHPELGRRIEETASLIPLPLHPVVLNERDFKSMRNARQASVVTEALDRNVILHGIEAYYGLIA